jgi:hypothetical protein
MESVFQILLFVGIPSAVIVTPMILRSRERLAQIALIRSAAERGEPLSVEIIKSLPGERTRGPQAPRDLRLGAILIGLGVALGAIAGLAAAFFPAFEGRNVVVVLMGAAGILPTFIGVALVGLARAEQRLVAD